VLRRKKVPLEALSEPARLGGGMQTVQNFRELQVGAVLLGSPSLRSLSCCRWPPCYRRVDARVVLAFRTILIGVACLMATSLTSQWTTDDFLPSQARCARIASAD
jgi:MFS transporter, DHA2 family, multidrug resistance protein